MAHALRNRYCHVDLARCGSLNQLTDVAGFAGVRRCDAQLPLVQASGAAHRPEVQACLARALSDPCTGQRKPNSTLNCRSTEERPMLDSWDNIWDQTVSVSY